MLMLRSTLALLLLTGQAAGAEPAIRFSKHLIADKYAYAYGIAAADIDGDGDLDLTSADYTPHNMLYLFENDGTATEGEWKKHMIEQDVAETRTIRAADFDGDGDIDLLGTGRKANQVIWYENHRVGGAVAWKKHLIDDKSVCPAHGNPA